MRHGTETINDFRLRGSSRCRCMGEYSTETRLFTWMVHTFDNHNASLRGWYLAAVVRGFPETPNQTRDYTDFPSLMRQSEARLRLVRPPLARPAARRTVGEDGGGSDPHVLAADAPRGRVRLFMPLFIPFPAPGGRSHHRDPFGKAEMPKTWTQAVLLNLALPLPGFEPPVQARQRLALKPAA